MSGRTVRAAKQAATMRRMATAAERAATIAREDAARDATHALPHAMLSSLGTSIHFRERAIAPLDTFNPDVAPAPRKRARTPSNGKNP